MQTSPPHPPEKERRFLPGTNAPGFPAHFSVIMCVMTLLMVACSGTSNSGGNSAGSTHTKVSKDKQVYIAPEIGVADIQTFDPGLSTDLHSISAIDMIFTGLVTFDDNLNVRAQLAQSWDESADSLTWTFHLRPNLQFSDGSPLTSHDVAYSIDRALQPYEKSTVGPIYLALIQDSDKLNAGKIKTIIGDSLLTPDDNTVVIKANKKATYFLEALTYSCSYVVEKSLIDKYGNTKFTTHLTEGGGAGPFMVSEYTPGKQIVFVPNPHYYGQKPQLQKVIFPFYKQEETAYQAYQVGQVSTANVPSPNLAESRKVGREYHQVPQLWINYYTMNYLVKPFDNIHIRQAFALAINKDVLAHNVLKDSVIATNHIVPQGMPGYNPNLLGPAGVKGTAGDAKKAQDLLSMGLQEEGWSSIAQMPPITFTYPSGKRDRDNETAAMVQMWQNVLGVSVKANAIDFNKLLDEITAATNNPKGLQMWRIGWIADYPDPQDWLTLQFDQGVPNNNMNYGQNDSADAAQQQVIQQELEAADVNPDQNARLQAYENAEQQLVNDAAWVPIEQVTASFLLKPCVQGLVFNPQSLTPPDDWARVYISTDTPCSQAQ
jgi:oligopeptide transport system substrate-binding protein